jgi:hypothetical protein
MLRAHDALLRGGSGVLLTVQDVEALQAELARAKAVAVAGILDPDDTIVRKRVAVARGI